MPERLTVWGVNIIYQGQRRAIVATRTKAEAIRLLGVSGYYFANYAADTGNAFELALAKSKPGTVFVHMADTSAPADRGEWIVLEPSDA